MALLASRYSKIYSKLNRPDLAHNFPRHVFIREPNKISQLRSGNSKIVVKHENLFDSTLIHLTEPFTNTELYLVGTMNCSNILANRTKNLIQEVKPDTLFVQTNEKWWKGASHLGHVKSQEEFELANKELVKAFEYKFPLNSRKLVNNSRIILLNGLWKFLFGLPLDYNPFLPGLEVKFALEEATKLKSNIVFLDYELDPLTKTKFYHENRFGLLKTAINFAKIKTTYGRELVDYTTQINNYGVKKFVESSCDQYFINWFIQLFDLIFPDVKRLIIEKKEEDLFEKIMINKGQKTVALVNQFHLEGLEHHWCHSFGQLPRNVRNININPIGDMDLRDSLFSHMFHVLSRDIKTSYSKSTPSSLSDHIIPYYRESNMQYEHRNM